MFIVLVIFTVLASILLIGVVLIQKSKGGGLSSAFAGSNQILGVRRTNNFIEKVTWTLACGIAVLAILCSYLMEPAVTKPRVEQPQKEVVGGTQYETNTDAAQTEQPTLPVQ